MIKEQQQLQEQLHDLQQNFTVSLQINEEAHNEKLKGTQYEAANVRTLLTNGSS